MSVSNPYESTCGKCRRDYDNRKPHKCRGAASRSEQSAASKIHGVAECPYGAEAHGFMAEHGSSAAEAAQSPQVGAAEEESCFPEGSAGELAETVVAWADFSLAHLNEHEPTYWIKNLRLVGAKWLREHAETGREGSDRPPVNPPVASADPELAALLRELQQHLSPRYFARDAELVARIDSALSRLAGQAATANENASGGAARGLPEEDR